jgi:PAS domain S-box-containing protein
MKKRTSRTSQDRTIQRLRRRLRETEDTLNAIRDGHVDALVVDSPNGEQLYTLRTADQPYRLMVEQMGEGALTLSADGTILYCNERFAQLMGADCQRITARNFRDFVRPEEQPRFQMLLEAETFRDDFQLLTADGKSRPAQLSAIAPAHRRCPHRRRRRRRPDARAHRARPARIQPPEGRIPGDGSGTSCTPLNVILGWTRMLLADHPSESAREHALRLIDRNAVAQAQLVNDLVDMSRMTTGKLSLDLEPLAIVPALEAALESAPGRGSQAPHAADDVAHDHGTRGRRRHAAAAGAVEPAVQRGEVHARGRHRSR